MKPIIGITTQFGEKGEEDEILYGIRPYYPDAVRKAGGIPLLLPMGGDITELKQILNLCAGIVIPGGMDVDPIRYSAHKHPTVKRTSPFRDNLDIPLIQQCFENKIPLLGICRGMQIMNVALGGTLWQDIPSEFPSAINHSASGDTEWTDLLHEIEIKSGTRLKNILKTENRKVNSLHHQGVSECSEKLIPSAKSPDGLIEAIEAPDHPFFLGVQWHPEALLENDTQGDLDLFKAFVTSCC